MGAYFQPRLVNVNRKRVQIGAGFEEKQLQALGRFGRGNDRIDHFARNERAVHITGEIVPPILNGYHEAIHAGKPAWKTENRLARYPS